MNIAKLMQQAQKLQSGLTSAKEKLAQEIITHEGAAGKVKVSVTADGNLKSLSIDPSIVDPEDVEFLATLLLTTIQEAQTQAKKKTESEMAKLTGGMGLPSGLF